MYFEPAGGLLAHLQQLDDPRGAQGRRHPFSAMLATIVGAVLCGARGYAAIAQWIHAQDPEVWYWMGYHRRPPTSYAYRNLLLMLSPDGLEAVLQAWIAGVLGCEESDVASKAKLQAIALDGKVLCKTISAHGRAVHLLSLLDQATGCVLSQAAVGESNEAKAALPLLKTLLLKGRVITGDAMFCQREVCQQIVDSGGDYLFTVKANQPELKAAIAAEFEAAFSPL